MKVLIFGATGMVGQGVLLECLRDPAVELVATLGRSATGGRDGKLREIVHSNLLDYAGMETQLAEFDACFFCLGVASTGMKEADYERVTYGFTMAAAEALSRAHPGMTFTFVSGSGTDSTERGRMMWARVKGRTENALLRLPLKAYYVPARIYSAARWHSVKDADVPHVLSRAGTGDAASAPALSQPDSFDSGDWAGDAGCRALWVRKAHPGSRGYSHRSAQAPIAVESE